MSLASSIYTCSCGYLPMLTIKYICDHDTHLRWHITMAPYTCATVLPLHNGSLHPNNDSPSSQWLPTPVQRFSLFMMAPYYIYHASVCDGIFTMVPYTCTTALPLHNV